MNEHDALLVTAVRAVEVSDRSRALWSDADRAWASRAAAEVVGERAAHTAFVSRRAALAFERLSTRQPALRRFVLGMRWRRWIGPLLAIVAFAAGLAIDRLDGARSINLLAQPVLALLVWNLVVYAWLVASPALRLTSQRSGEPGTIRAAIVRASAHLDRAPRRDASSPLGAALAAFASDWTARATPLYAVRAARVLHIAAAALAAGVIAGLYLRGLAFEYRATWESTFLDAATVHRILSIAMWPGAIATGIPVPTVAEIEAIRSSATPASANAASWLHLIAATVMLVVIVPRLLLALFAWVLEKHRASHIALGLDDPYFQRVVRGFHGGPVRVTVVPYSYRVPPASLAGIQAIVSRVFGGSASLVMRSPVAYGDEDQVGDEVKLDAGGPAVALFNLAATPEREAHAAFVAALAAAAGAQPTLVLVDEAPFRARAEGDARRLDERRATWRDLFAERGLEPIFVDLEVPDLARAESAIEARLEAVAVR